MYLWLYLWSLVTLGFFGLECNGRMMFNKTNLDCLPMGYIGNCKFHLYIKDDFMEQDRDANELWLDYDSQIIIKYSNLWGDITTDHEPIKFFGAFYLEKVLNTGTESKFVLTFTCTGDQCKHLETTIFSVLYNAPVYGVPMIVLSIRFLFVWSLYFDVVLKLTMPAIVTEDDKVDVSCVCNVNVVMINNTNMDFIAPVAFRSLGKVMDNYSQTETYIIKNPGEASIFRFTCKLGGLETYKYIKIKPKNEGNLFTSNKHLIIGILGAVLVAIIVIVATYFLFVKQGVGKDTSLNSSQTSEEVSTDS